MPFDPEDTDREEDASELEDAQQEAAEEREEEGGYQ